MVQEMWAMGLHDLQDGLLVPLPHAHLKNKKNNRKTRRRTHCRTHVCPPKLHNANHETLQRT